MALLPAGLPGVDPPLRREHRREVVVCPRSPVMGSEVGDGWLEGLWIPEIVDFLGSLPF